MNLIVILSDNDSICDSSSLPREGRISSVRNEALSFLQQQNWALDYVVSVDMDIIGWDVNGIADSFGSADLLGWDVMCAMGVTLHGVYRDVYAFRSENIDTNHHLHGRERYGNGTGALTDNLRHNRYLDAYKNFSVGSGCLLLLTMLLLMLALQLIVCVM